MKKEEIEKHCRSSCRRDGCPHEEQWEEETNLTNTNSLEKTIKCDVFPKDTYYDIARRFAENFGDNNIIDGFYLYAAERYRKMRQMELKYGDNVFDKPKRKVTNKKTI